MGLLFFVSMSNAQPAAKLYIGDKMPDIKPARWLQGTPVATIKNENIYVVEFWATWCGACIMAMPHISELAEKYKGKATFLGCDVYEETHGKTYDAAQSNVERFIKSEANHMTYPVFEDTKEKYMADNWLSAAGVQGVPYTFVIKNGKLIWIGDPRELDKVIDSIVNGTLDIVLVKNRNDQRLAALAKSKAVNKPLDDAIASKDYAKAIEIIDQRIAETPQIYLKMKKFNILKDGFGEKRALEYLTELKDKKDKSAFEIARTLPGQSGFSKEAYLLSIEIMNGYSGNYDVVNRIASARQRIGDISGAISAEQKAISLAKEALAKTTNSDIAVLLKKCISDYGEKLAGFQSLNKD